MLDRADTKERDELIAGARWTFDEQVTRAFDDMLERSIPQYGVMRSAVRDIALAFLDRDGKDPEPLPLVLDLGCSRGEMIAMLRDRAPPTRFVGVDVSDPMLTAARERFAGDPEVEIAELDLRRGYPSVPPARVTLSVLTLQFIPVECRREVIRQVYEHSAPGGCLILVEKVLGETAPLDEIMVARHLAMKRANGYSEEQIVRKRLALEGVLVPMTARANEELLTSAGFEAIDCFWRWMNFAAWVAVRSA